MALKYHHTTFRLLGEEPRVSGEAVQKMNNWEAEHGVLLPASVREWYSHEGVAELLTMKDQSCGSVEVDYFLQELLEDMKLPMQVDPPCACIFGAMRVNTGYYAYVFFDGSDDPPVSDELWPDYEFAEDTNHVPFSIYILDTLRWMLSENNPSLSVRVEEVSPHLLTALEEKFDHITLPPSKWTDESQTVFLCGGLKTIAVSSQSIQIIAKTEEELFNLYESIAFVPLLSIHLGRQVSGTHFAKRFPNEKEVRLHYENTRKQTKRKSLWKQFFGL
jgi:hypothetical protein